MEVVYEKALISFSFFFFQNLISECTKVKTNGNVQKQIQLVVNI